MSRDPFEAIVPRPRKVETTPGEFTLRREGLIALSVDGPLGLLDQARRVGEGDPGTNERIIDWEIVAGNAAPAEDTRLQVSISDREVVQPEGYRLTAAGDRIDLVAHDLAGARYGLDTVRQMLSVAGVGAVPSVLIEDHPALQRRGYMLDVSRDKVPTMATLFGLVDVLADLRFNELQLYTEHTFAYRRHPLVWADASPMTGEQVMDLDAYCVARGVELVPNQNSFGHLERWFAHEPYRALAEMPDGFTTPYGTTYPHGFSLDASNPEIFGFLGGLYDELLPHFASRRFNVGLDETWDLGRGRSASLVDARGQGRVYLDTLLGIAELVHDRGHEMLFWGDIVSDHPDLVGDLPEGLVALEWGYEADHRFSDAAERYVAAGVPFRLCPGTAGWNSIGGRVDNALTNIERSVDTAVEYGAEGILLTDWGDNGHWQPLPVSLPGLVRAGTLAWCPEANRDADVAAQLATVTHDDSGLLGRYLDQLGNAYRRTGLISPNSTPLFWMLQLPSAQLPGLLDWTDPRPSSETVAAALFETDDLLAGLERSLELEPPRPERLGADIVVDELTWVTRMLRAAALRGRTVLTRDAEARRDLADRKNDLLEGHHRVWLHRNRPGGQLDSVRRLERALGDV